MLGHIIGTMLYNLIKSSIMGSIICADCYVRLKLVGLEVTEMESSSVPNQCIKVQAACVWGVRRWPTGSFHST